MNKSRNGIYNKCLGSACPTSCCNLKKIRIDDGKSPITIDITKTSLHNNIDMPYTLDGPLHHYNTSVTLEEAKNIYATNLDIAINQVQCVTGILPDHKVITDSIITISNCLGEVGCKLGENKPIMCKYFPFPIMIEEITSHGSCPTRYDIFADDENMRNVLMQRKIAGFQDNRDYVFLIYHVLSSHGKEPQRTFINDEEFLRAEGCIS